MKDNQQPQPIRLEDYTPPPYRVDSVDLRFELGEDATRVQARLAMVRSAPEPVPLRLDGRELELVSLQIDGQVLEHSAYSVDDEGLTIASVPEHFVVEIETRLRPQDNTSLEGLYKSSGNFCTQCEAQGFRKITYFPDRPDIMARYATTIVADPQRYPVMLSNGNSVEEGHTDDGRRWVRWEDPFPKPCYLFALVAGDLRYIEDTHVTASGRRVALRIYVEPENIDKCDHAMESLKKAMAWDERVFGLEYDLDIYMIVAVNDFNMGAMENKGLNIFNSKYVLARPDTATDDDYDGILGVIGHEYFHNWTGNRVTCRDWFQLSLKEGLTVFRDQEFSADMTSRAVKRIQDVRMLRARQFPEDDGPMAHPVRPDAYVEINNFYTATVYEKGAEVVRMYQTLLGREGFRRGMDLYFQRHDGQAVTTDDFYAAMADANDADLGEFKRWYSQAGTPRVQVESDYDRDRQVYTLRMRQSCPPTPGQHDKQPLLIPVAVGLLDQQGRPLPLQLEGEGQPVGSGTRVLRLGGAEEEYRFVNVPEAPLPSLLRGFSAPVRLEYPYSDEELGFLMAHDSDLFNRWEAGQQLSTRVALALLRDLQAGEPLALSAALVEAYRRLLGNGVGDKALVAEALVLPSEEYLAEQVSPVDPAAIHRVREFLRAGLASALRQTFWECYRANRETGPYSTDPAAMGRRRLKNICLGYLMELDDAEARRACVEELDSAHSMTDVIAALNVLANCECEEREPALEGFYRKWRHDPLVVDKWFALQARSKRADTLARVKVLMRHEAFEIRNPNRVRALVGAFSHGNPARFHDPSGAGYEFLVDMVLRLDGMNPMVAARLLGALSRWRRFEPGRSAKMRQALATVRAHQGLSKDCYEIADKSLAEDA
ncbi:MAG: aminopeptidase N [Gammaproteobacteria bacterium]